MKTVEIIAQEATVELPIGDPEPHGYTGLIIGPFFAHRGVSDDGRAVLVGDAGVSVTPGAWTVTHLQTGRAVQRNIPSLEAAAWLANALGGVDECWDISSKQQADAVWERSGPTIRVLMEQAVSGDCLGAAGGIRILRSAAPGGQS